MPLPTNAPEFCRDNSDPTDIETDQRDDFQPTQQLPQTDYDDELPTPILLPIVVEMDESLTPTKESFNQEFASENNACSPTALQHQQSASHPMDSDQGAGHVLPAICGAGDVKRISGETMVRLLSGEFRGSGDNQLDDFVIIDCRYDYEYAGGHISGAININDRAALIQFFRQRTAHPSHHSHRVGIIFHCEFSQNRAPRSYRFFRDYDRKMNSANYPALFFPELCVLDGGYKQFYAQFPEHCSRTVLNTLDGNIQQIIEPGSYVSMWAPEHAHDCKTRTHAHRKSWGTGKLLSASHLMNARSPAKRGEKRSSSMADCTESPESQRHAASSTASFHLQFSGEKPSAAQITPGRSMSMPAGMNSARQGLFSPIGALGLFASPMRTGSADGNFTPLPSASSTHIRSSPMKLSPLPSFSLLSAQVSPASPDLSHKTKLGDSLGLLPVPFHMAISPDKQ